MYVTIANFMPFFQISVSQNMASSADVREIMGMAPVDTTITKEQIIGTDKKR